MRNYTLILSFTISILLATTNNTITIDGTSSDWASDEDLTTSTSGWKNYLTWKMCYEFILYK